MQVDATSKSCCERIKVPTFIYRHLEGNPNSSAAVYNLKWRTDWH